MAFLTYRDSNKHVTEAQREHRDVILGVPLSIQHIDANFAALNREVVDVTRKYGLGTTWGGEVITLGELFPTTTYGDNLNDDLNRITRTGFYRIAENAKNTPKNGPDDELGRRINGVLLHIQRADGAPNVDSGEAGGSSVPYITALQITSSINDLGTQEFHFRVNEDNGWREWTTLAQLSDLNESSDQINEILATCVKNTGGTINGNLEVTQTLSLSNINNIFSMSMANGAIPTVNAADGFHFYDNTKSVNPANKTGFIGIRQTEQQHFSGAVLSAADPQVQPTGAEGSANVRFAEIMVGWRHDANGNYREYTYAPAPNEDALLPSEDRPAGSGNQIATTDWVLRAIDNVVTSVDSFTTRGGTITGDVVIAPGESGSHSSGNLEVEGKTTLYGDTLIMGSSIFDDDTCVVLGIPKGTKAQPNEVEEAGYYIVGVATGDMNTQIGGSLTGEVNSVGTFTTSMSASQWKANADKEASISVSISQNGNEVTTSAPTPKTDSNDNNIATTQWVRTVATNITNTALNAYQNSTGYNPTSMTWDLGELT